MKITGIGENNLNSFRGFIESLLPGQQALGLIADGDAAGAAVFSASGSSLILDYIYVNEAYRRGGGGTMLLQAAADAAGEMGITGMMAFYREDPQISAFLATQGFVFFPAQQEYSFEAAELLASRKSFRLAEWANLKRVKYYNAVSKAERNLLVKLLQKMWFNPTVLADGLFDPELSFVSVKNDVPNGLLLAQRDGSDIVITMLASSDKNEKAGLNLAAAFFYAIVEIEADSIDRIRFLSSGRSILDVIRHLLPDEGMIKMEKRIISAYRS